MGGRAIGIQLGTTYSRVGVFSNGKVQIIANERDNRITPSHDAPTDTSELLGDEVMNQAVMNPHNTMVGE